MEEGVLVEEVPPRPFVVVIRDIIFYIMAEPPGLL